MEVHLGGVELIYAVLSVGGAYSSALICEEDDDAGVFSASLRVCAFSLSWGTCNSGTAARCRKHGG